MSALTDQITSFLTYLELEKNRSERTIISYAHYLQRFSQFAEQQGIHDVKQLSASLLSNYRLWLNRHTKLAKRSQDYHIIALRSFLRFLQKRGFQTLPPEAIELGKAPARQITFLETHELKRLLATHPAAKDQHGLLVSLRDRAILICLFSTGLRLSELTQLDRTTINLDTKEVAVTGKGGKNRLVFLSDEAAQSIAAYLKERGDTSTALFIGHGLRPSIRLTPRSIERIVATAARRAGIVKKVTPHVLRHSFATDLLRSGADLRSIQQLLGHASVTTTQIYTHVTDPHLKEVHTKYHGKSLKH